MIVATAGHIDHGKTTLIKALTGVDTDRLPEEKARGISIDLGFAHWKNAHGADIAFVDVPGHERFIRNMLAGICAVDYVVLVVAADDGVMPQTIEHLQIVDLLEVTQGVVAVTKIDRVADQQRTAVIKSVQDLLAPTVLRGIPVVPMSTTTGVGLAELRHELSAAAKTHVARECTGRNFRYAIDRAFTIPGSGTVVTGTVLAGSVATGDGLVLSPGGVEVRVRAIQERGQSTSRSVAGSRCALNLTGVAVEQIMRGDWIVAPPIHAPTQCLDTRVRVLGSEEHPLKHWTQVHLHLGASDVSARVVIRGGKALAPGDSGIVRLVADRPLAALHGDRFILRDQASARTIGGGLVLNPFAVRARASRSHSLQLAAMEHADPGEALAALLAVSPQGVSLTRFEQTLNLTKEHSQRLLASCDAVVVDKQERTALLRKTTSTTGQRILEELARFHRDSPRAPGAEISIVHKAAAPALARTTFAALAQALAANHEIELAGSQMRLPGHVATANPADEAMWRTIKTKLDAAGLAIPALGALSASTRIGEAALKDFLHRKSRTGDLIRVGKERFFPRRTMAQIAAIATSVADAAPGGQITVGQFRDSCGIGRSLALEILDCLDRLGITHRTGDVRRIYKDFVQILGPACTPPAPVEVASEAGDRTDTHARKSCHIME